MGNTDPTPYNPRLAGPDRSGLGAPFWRLWTSSGLSNLADGVLKMALPLVALRFTDSPALIAGIAVALSLPWLFFALPAGALADRVDRRLAMLSANTLRGGLITLLTAVVVLDFGSIWLLYAVAFLIGATETVYDTTAQSILPQIIPRSQLSRGNGRLYAVELSGQEFIGPPLGSALVAVGVGLALVTPAVLWIAAVGALLLVRGTFKAERNGPSTSMRADIAEGVRFLWTHSLLRTFALMVGVSNFALSALVAVIVVFAVGPNSPMGLTESAFGFLFAMIAAGSLIGALATELCERTLGRTRSLWLSVVLYTVVLAVPGLTTNVWLVGLGFITGGIGLTVWNVITVSLRQRMTPGPLLGRVNSVYRLLAWGTRPLGAAAGGLIAEFFGFQAMFLGLALLTLTLLIPLSWVNDVRLDEAERVGSELDQNARGEQRGGKGTDP